MSVPPALVGAYHQLSAALRSPPPSTSLDWAMPLASVLLIYASYATLSHLDTVFFGALSGGGRPTASKALHSLHFLATLGAVVAFGSLVSFVDSGGLRFFPPTFIIPTWISSLPTGPTFLATLLSFLTGFVLCVLSLARRMFPPVPVPRPRTTFETSTSSSAPPTASAASSLSRSSDASALHDCEVCGKPAVSSCSGCGVAQYCSRACQMSN